MYSNQNLTFIWYILCILSLPADFAHINREKNAIKIARHDRSHELFSTDWHIRCKLQPIGYDCNQNETNPHRFYFDILMQTCKTFQYGECDLSFNTFYTLQDCSDTCLTPGTQGVGEDLSMDLKCRLQPDFGACNSYYPMYYFDVSTRKCTGFAYSGCGGNGNKFVNAMSCDYTCRRAVRVPQRIKGKLRAATEPTNTTVENPQSIYKRSGLSAMQLAPPALTTEMSNSHNSSDARTSARTLPVTNVSRNS